MTMTVLVERQPEDSSAAMENCGDDNGAGGEAARGQQCSDWWRQPKDSSVVMEHRMVESQPEDQGYKY